MEIRVAEQFLQHASALHEQADVHGIRHAHAAMHLHTLAHGEIGRRAGARLRHRDDRAGLVRRCVESLRGLGDGGARDLQLAEEVRSPMLQRLEFAKRFAELLALLQVRDGA